MHLVLQEIRFSIKVMTDSILAALLLMKIYVLLHIVMHSKVEAVLFNLKGQESHHSSPPVLPFYSHQICMVPLSVYI